MPHDFDCRAFVAERDGHDIEPARAVVCTMTSKEVARGLDESPALRRGHGFGRRPKRSPLARLDLDEDDGRTVGGDDVDFSTRRPVPAHENCVPEALELANSEIFANFAQPDTRAGNALARSKLRARGRALCFGQVEASAPFPVTLVTERV